jgi:thioesterase domain-containing protein
MNAAEFERHLHQTIPISRQMGVKVIDLSDQRSLLGGQLAPNINHVQTAFGGSLYAVAALACYGLFWALAAKTSLISDNLVIQEGRNQYLHPVDGDFEVESVRPSEEDIQKFFELLQRHGRARLELSAEVRVRGKVAATFVGTYVSRLRS